MSRPTLPIGPKSRAWMESVGIRSLQDLQALGSVAAWSQAKAAHPREVSLNLLWALEGLLCGRPWNRLPPGRKEELLAQLAATPFQPGEGAGTAP